VTSGIRPASEMMARKSSVAIASSPNPSERDMRSSAAAAGDAVTAASSEFAAENDLRSEATFGTSVRSVKNKPFFA
jgi:hypothetical protein